MKIYKYEYLIMNVSVCIQEEPKLIQEEPKLNTHMSRS